MKPDIERRNKLILKLYLRGVPRKQIPLVLILTPPLTYDTVKKALNASGIFEWHYERRKKPRD